jgi:hypothetical protein
MGLVRGNIQQGRAHWPRGLKQVTTCRAGDRMLLPAAGDVQYVVPNFNSLGVIKAHFGGHDNPVKIWRGFS